MAVSAEDGVQSSDQRADVRLEDIDLTDLDLFTDHFPHEWFTLLRREAPVWWHEATSEIADGHGFWVCSKYDDVVTVSRDAQLFSSEGSAANPHGGVFLQDIGAAGGVGSMMLVMDPPKHTRYRRIVSSAFTPKVMRLFEQQIRRRATEIVDAVIERGSCDFVTEIAAELTLQAIAELLGVPQEDRLMLFDWTNRLIGSQDPEYSVSMEQATEAQVEMFSYADRIGEEKRKHPADDIVTAFVNAEVDGERLDQMEFDMFFMLLTVAGNETTRNGIAHGMQTFFEHPDQWERLKADPGLIDSAVEEIVRWASPVIYFRRTATRATELRGQRIEEGDKVVMVYPSANRDEDVFDRPFDFDIARNPNPQVGFGGRGPHHCLGANLARMEMRVMFEEVARRMPDLRPVRTPDRLRSNLINGLKHLPVEFTPGPRVG